MAVSPKLRDVAARAGVHPGTASRALNPATRAMVNPDTARRVQEAARLLGYQPSPPARGLRLSRGQSVGMLVPDLANPIYPPIARGAEEVLRAAGYTTLLADSGDDTDRAAVQFAALRARQVEGFLVGTAHREDRTVVEAVADGLAVVLVYRVPDLATQDGRPTVSAVVSDDRRGIGMAVRHLVDLGHTRVAHLAGPEHTSTGHGRRVLFADQLARAGLTANPDLVVSCAGFTEDAGRAAMHALLDRGTFTAVVCANDMVALGAHGALTERGLSCPEDVSLVGYNDMPHAGQLRPPLTTVRVPDGRMGAEAAELLLERIADPTRPAKVVTVPPEFVRRASTAPPRVAASSRHSWSHRTTPRARV